MLRDLIDISYLVREALLRILSLLEFECNIKKSFQKPIRQETKIYLQFYN